MAEDSCSHLNAITKVKHPARRNAKSASRSAPAGSICGPVKVGVTLCCDDSPNRHATKHAHASGHPVIARRTWRAMVILLSDDAFAEY